MTSHPARRRFLALAAALAFGGALPPQAFADTFPAKPVKLVVGYAAGGATDVISRLLAVQLGEQTGQSFIVDNRSGANSNVGAELVARAPADGYTLYLYTIANTINVSLYDRLGYDPQKDFEPIGLIAKIPNILVVNPKLPIASVADYVRFAREQPRGITFASSGSGSSIHLSGEMFKMVSKSNMLHVPYRGSAPAVADLLGGQVESMFDNTPSALPHVQARRLRAIAITSATRSPLLPDVPTFEESGVKGYAADAWYGLLAPAGTPPDIVARLTRISGEFSRAPATAEKLRGLGMQAQNTCGGAFAAQLDGEIKAATKTARELDLKLD